MDILFEDDSIILIRKPAATPSQPDKTGDKDMLTAVTEHAGHGFIVHRLDRPVGGLMLFAKTDTACTKLSKDFACKKVRKTYMAVVCGHAPEQAELRHFLRKNARLNISEAVGQEVHGAKEAVLYYRTIEVCHNTPYGILSAVEVDLYTGRHHQIRVQMAAAGLPIWGDTKYNKAFAKPNAFVFAALWAYKLDFTHPSTGKAMAFCDIPPNDRTPFCYFNF